MPSPFSIFSRKKPSRPFKNFYSDWFSTLNETLIPHLRRSLSSSSSTLISSAVDLLLRHLISYYESLDLSAEPHTLPLLLHPSWRTPLETPFLFLGDLHPYLFTNLLRSLIDRDNNNQTDDISDLGFDCRAGLDKKNDIKTKEIHDDDINGSVLVSGLDINQFEDLDKTLQVAMAWKNPSNDLMARIDQIERAMRLIVPDLVARARLAQVKLAGRVAEDWASFEGKTKKKAVMMVEEAVREEMEELVSVFVDANRLRRSVITDIVGATNEFQAALFLEGLAQFLVGFRDPELVGESEQ